MAESLAIAAIRSVYASKRSSNDASILEVILPDGVRAKLDRLYEVKRWAGHDMGDDAAFFISRKKGRLSARRLRHDFKVWQERAGFDRHFNFHSLRHSAIRQAHPFR